MPIDLQEILKHHQASLLADLDMARSVFANAEAKGDATEFEWLKVIDEFLPNRYQCSAAFVLDSNGDVSEFIDVVIHDRHFCPLLFEQGGQKYIPAESVYAVLETKQQIDKGNIEYASGKGASVRRLHRTNSPIQHAGGTYEPRPLFPIITGILATESDWSPPFGDAFNDAITATAGEGTKIDIGCALRHGAFDVDWIAHESPTVTIGKADSSLMFFLMHLFGRLQALGTVPAIDLTAYGRSLEA
jgi:hypothetical protein